jgi:predicted DNA-binding transcriptional regulator AlpA
MAEPEKVNRQLSFKDLSAKKGIRWSRMTVWRKMKAKRFPQCFVDPETGRVHWDELEIDEYRANLQRGLGRKPPPKKGLQAKLEKPGKPGKKGGARRG